MHTVSPIIITGKRAARADIMYNCIFIFLLSLCTKTMGADDVQRNLYTTKIVSM